MRVLVEHPYRNVTEQIFSITDDKVTARRPGELDIDLGTMSIELPDFLDTDTQSDSTDTEQADAGPDAGVSTNDAGYDPLKYD